MAYKSRIALWQSADFISYKIVILSALFWLSLCPVKAQQIAIKTNLLYDATLTPNIGMELSSGSHSSFQLSYGLRPWTSGDKMLRHWSLMPEYRYWLCAPLTGHFFGVHALGGQYRAGGYDLPFGLLPDLKDTRYVGWFVGAGLAYGYTYALSRHWNLEGEVGLGVVHTRYTQYECEKCGAELGRERKTFFSPTKLALNLVYVF